MRLIRWALFGLAGLFVIVGVTGVLITTLLAPALKGWSLLTGGVSLLTLGVGGMIIKVVKLPPQENQQPDA